MSLYPLVHQFVLNAFRTQPAMIKHLERTEYWARTLRPHIDEALRCAAVAHDIERSEPNSETNRPFRQSPFQNKDALVYHQRRGAEMIGAFLHQQGIQAKLIQRIKSLIETHEVGGDSDQDFIKDVDSLSFLENNLAYFMENLMATHGVKDVIAKFDWMYERITDPTIRQLAHPHYLEAVAKLKTNQHSNNP
ncbi:MAG: DUF4202 family protein [Pseudomonadales bacterium]|nr:DUF4202 family protein [Pseudomonadales bacterium]